MAVWHSHFLGVDVLQGEANGGRESSYQPRQIKPELRDRRHNDTHHNRNQTQIDLKESGNGMERVMRICMHVCIHIIMYVP